MRHLLMTLGMYSGFVLEAGLAARITALPDLLAVTGLLALLVFDDWRGLVWLGFSGFLSDCLRSGLLGPGLAAATIIGCFAHRLRLLEQRRSPWLLAVCAGALVFVTRMEAIFLSPLDRLAHLNFAACREIAICAGATAALALLVALLLKRASKGEGKLLRAGARTFSYRLVADGDA